MLLAGLIPDFGDPFSPEELAGFACEELVESRIVSQSDSGFLEASNGPFDEKTFQQLPDTNWTLLVQAVDQWVEEVASIKSLFDFLPSWRIDDIMVSYATPGGSVGPHYDFYDVFLLQGQGHRNWKVGQHCTSDAQLQEHTDLRLLSEFEQNMEYELTAGDALYIPPRFAHWGTATSDSLCYSVGFRAPSAAEMIEGFSDFIIGNQDPANRYTDDIERMPENSGEILPGSLEKSYSEIVASLSDREKFTTWFGCHVTQPKYPELVQSSGIQFSNDDLRNQLQEGMSFAKNPSSRFAFLESTNDGLLNLFVDGAMTVLPATQRPDVEALCAATDISLANFAIALTDDDMAELLRQLVYQGSLLTPD